MIYQNQFKIELNIKMIFILFKWMLNIIKDLRQENSDFYKEWSERAEQASDKVEKLFKRTKS
jgi:hypothetical protein